MADLPDWILLPSGDEAADQRKRALMRGKEHRKYKNGRMETDYQNEGYLHFKPSPDEMSEADKMQLANSKIAHHANNGQAALDKPHYLRQDHESGDIQFARSLGATSWEDTPYPGMLERGNLDVSQRRGVANPDGSFSTIRTRSYNIGGEEVLLPTLDDAGNELSDDEVISRYRTDGLHLGKFKDSDVASAYARRLSEQQGQNRLMQGGNRQETIPPRKPYYGPIR